MWLGDERTRHLSERSNIWFNSRWFYLGPVPNCQCLVNFHETRTGTLNHILHKGLLLKLTDSELALINQQRGRGNHTWSVYFTTGARTCRDVHHHHRSCPRRDLHAVILLRNYALLSPTFAGDAGLQNIKALALGRSTVITFIIGELGETGRQETIYSGVLVTGLWCVMFSGSTPGHTPFDPF